METIDGWIDEDNTMLGHLYKRKINKKNKGEGKVINLDVSTVMMMMMFRHFLKLDGEQKETYCLGCFLADLAGGGLNLAS